VTVDSVPPPPADSTAAAPDEAVQEDPGAQPVTEPETTEPEAAAPEATEAEAADPPDLAASPGLLNYSPAVRIGARVDDVRAEPGEIVVEVGDSLEMGEDFDVVAYDHDGDPLRGVRILSTIDSRFAVLEEGHIKGVAEGDTELRMAIRVPPASGTGAPEIRNFSAPLRVVGPPVVSLEIEDPGVRFFTGTVVQVTGGERAGTGDGVRVAGAAVGAEGAGGERVAVDYTVSSFQGRTDMGASSYSDGAFVAERPGLYRIAATANGSTGLAFIDVSERGVEHEVSVVGRGTAGPCPTSDLWAFTGVDGRDYVYTGTHVLAGGGGGMPALPPEVAAAAAGAQRVIIETRGRPGGHGGGQAMHVWDVTDPGNPILTDQVEVDARVVNDVKVNSRGTVAAITREGASDRRNGIVMLDLTDPAHPVVVDEYTETLTGGVHNVFFSGDILYAIHNGTFDVHILDVSDPGDVEEVGRWGIETPGKYLHDIWVLDGMAYVSYWNDGIYILDAGDGRWGGTPTEPVEVSHFAYAEGNTHFAFPYTNADGHRYLFVGDEIFDCEECISRNGYPGDGSRGFVHIFDLEDPENLREVARYEVPEAGAHNLWVEDDVMYVAYYQAGLRVVDVSGELRGDLYKQGREMAWFTTGLPTGQVPNAPMAWGPQPFKGHVFVSDMHSGLWVVKVEPKNRAPVS